MEKLFDSFLFRLGKNAIMFEYKGRIIVLSLVRNCRDNHVLSHK